jgi:hypothetical protein
MDRVVFFNVAWMKEYKGIIKHCDTPAGGGTFVKKHGYGHEIYNFQPFRGKMYGFVEAGYRPAPRCIDITRLGASRLAVSISNILVVWVARNRDTHRTVVVGWYKDATVYKRRQEPPQGSNRKLPGGRDALYFVEANEQNCKLIPASKRDCEIPKGEEGGFGQSNIWHAEGALGAKVRAKVLGYIGNWGSHCEAGDGCL